MVHFSCFTAVKQMVKLDFLKVFENIVLMELGPTLPRTLWNALYGFFEIFVFVDHHRKRPPAKIKLVLLETNYVSRHRLSMWFFKASSGAGAIRSAHSLFSKCNMFWHHNTLITSNSETCRCLLALLSSQFLITFLAKS